MFVELTLARHSVLGCGSRWSRVPAPVAEARAFLAGQLTIGGGTDQEVRIRLLLGSGSGNLLAIVWFERCMMKALLITLIVAASPCAALAQVNQDWKSCKAEDPDDTTISACTHLIETNELGPDDRAVAYCRRGAAYWRNGDYDTLYR